MSRAAYNGGVDVGQSSLANAEAAATDLLFPALIEGVIVQVHYPEDASNKSKFEVEYDVDPTSLDYPRIRNVPRGDLFGGIDDGDDAILRVASSPNADGTSEFVKDTSPGSSPTPRYESTGDRVLVGFVNSSYSRPVIVGVLTHKRTRKGLKDVSGKDLPRGQKLFRRTRHRGTELVLDENGNASLTFAKVPGPNGRDTSSKKTLTIVIGDFKVVIDNSSSPTTMTIQNPNGDALFKVTKDAFEVGTSGLESMVMGDALTTFLNHVKTAVNTHTHTPGALVSPSGAVTGNTGPPMSIPTPPLNDTVDVKSTWAKVSKSKP